MRRRTAGIRSKQIHLRNRGDARQINNIGGGLMQLWRKNSLKNVDADRSCSQMFPMT